MITLKFPINLSEEDKLFIQELQEVQSGMIRSAYVASRKGLSEKDIRPILKERFKESKADSWFQQSAIKSAIGMTRADKELGITSRIFGGKSNFIRRCKGLIDNALWKKSRLLPVYLVGESPAEGNRKFIFFQNSIVFKPFKGKRIEIKLPSIRKKWAGIWSDAVIRASNSEIPITVSLTDSHICLTFSSGTTSIKKVIKNRYAGIDLNPNFIGVSVFDGEKMVSSRLYSLKSLTGKDKGNDKLDHETREIGHGLGRWLKHLQVDKVFIEQLNFGNGDKGLGKNFNRLTTNQWKKNIFKSILSKYFILNEINAAYSSTIGNILRPDLPDPIAASTEIARRGSSLLISSQKQFYPALPALKYLQDLWKETSIPVVSHWKELHDWIKKSKMKYRIPVDETVLRSMTSRHSSVYFI